MRRADFIETMAEALILLYDSDCGICTFFARLVHLVDLRGRIEFIALSDPRADPWFLGTTEGERYGSFHAAQQSGERVSHGQALLAVLAALSLGGGVVRRATDLPRAVALADWVYRIMLRYRTFLAGKTTSRGATSAPSDSS